MKIEVLKIDTPSLGDRSYLAHDGKTAVIVDPQRDVDRFNAILDERNLKLGAVIETHVHNDYLSGGLELAREHDAPYLINKDDGVKFSCVEVIDQQEISVGGFGLKVRKTPGHTYNHLSYELCTEENKVVALFTGGSLLHGATGRPDLLGWENAAELAGLQYDSAHSLVDSLDDELEIFPTHGFGSFCSATPTLADFSRIKDEKMDNPVFNQDRESYISKTLEALDVYPTYFKFMASRNIEGPGPIDLTTLKGVSAQELKEAIRKGDWVVDLRNRVEWANQHLAGSVSLGLDGSFASYLGWLHRLDAPIYLSSENASDISMAQRELVRIGVDRPTASHIGKFENSPDLKSIRIVKFSDLSSVIDSPNITVLDVRQLHERNKSHLSHSRYIPFYEMESRVEELPSSTEIWVHCTSGYRAAAVLKFIEDSGRLPVLINDDFANALTYPALQIISQGNQKR